jgi:hypothetical protein
LDAKPSTMEGGYMNSEFTISKLFFAAVFMCLTSAASATVVDMTVLGTDSIFLAGRTDLTIPDPSQPWPGGLGRHPVPTPEELQETLPPIVTVRAGQVIKAASPAFGGISFYNGYGDSGAHGIFGPSGGSGETNLLGFGGISGFLSDGGGPLVGVFLDESIPNGVAPPRLDFTASGIGTDFLALAPVLGQVFYIGDGITSEGVFQEFIAPFGATRLALGIPDGFGFDGAPGAYDDNDGMYRLRIDVPEPTTLTLMCLALTGIGLARQITNPRNS